MNRYLNSLFLTSLIYTLSGAILYITFNNIITLPKSEEEVITKISLNSVEISQAQPVAEPTPPEPEPEPEIIPEPVVEAPTPVKKVKKKPKKKPVEKVVEKQVEEMVEVKEVVESKNVAKEVSAPPQMSQSQKDDIESRYLAKVKAKVEHHKIYPRSAKRLNQTGKVEVNFDILKDGKVKNVRIGKKSRFERLDEASVELLIKIGFFDHIPSELNRTVWNITIPIDYQIN